MDTNQGGAEAPGEKKEVEEEEEGDTEKDEEEPQQEEEERKKPVCWFGSNCFRKSKKHLSKYAHPASTGKSSTNLLATAAGAVKQILQGKRKREESKVEGQEEQEEGGSKRLKPFEGDEEPTQPDEGEEQEAFAAVEPTLIVTEDCGDDEGPTQIIEEVVEVETTQMVVETLEATKPKLTRQFSSQMHLDAFLDKMKEREEENRDGEKQKEKQKEAGADGGGEEQEADTGGEPTQLIVTSMEGDGALPSTTTAAEDAPTLLVEMEEDNAEHEKKDQEETKPVEKAPLEAPSPDLPEGYVDAWDNENIKLPCSPQNTYRRVGTRSRRLLSRWYLIHTVLSVPMRSSLDLQEAIIAYNCTEDSKYAQYWDFSALHYFFQQLATKEEFDTFFDTTLPFIIRLALRLPELFSEPTPLLAMGEDRTLVLTQEQVACLLANGFLCTFPKQGPQKKGRKGQYPSFSFHTLFMGAGERCLPNQAAKLRCVFHYFERVAHKMPTGVVSFERRVLEDEPPWGECDTGLAELIISDDGCIEDVQEECLQIDFANKMVGGGVLGYGCIQEEIRFMINTELIASLLFTARLQDNECLLITGAERYSKYTGYAKTFRYAGDYEDQTPRDELGRRRTQVIAMDALFFGSYSIGRLAQYRLENIERELNKCYVTFSTPSIPPLDTTPVATGNWGCGAFGGFHDVKAIIQLMAAAVAGRPLRYFTFGEPGLANALKEVYAFLREKRVTVSALWEVLCDVSGEVTAYLDRSQGEGEDDEEEDNTPPMSAPQLFNLLFDRFDVTPKSPNVEDGQPTAPPAKGKEKVQNDEDDEATVEL
ncbi:poly(adpribose) glycohydrolase, putative [Acanthamoeba castellanii str. Neff]|uniref:poly(ADP-ribose) glycohydrolase n=1 Tax=Acanthamoeba castellanii (strain ATCC 30010 / Neff) TaxID=1257118 RepID=L8GXY7_ACACF|nr:poly(adpribose) glycohydrolase, putative [Acanthamoeba castellanii str. Neff]ELR17423.1 poly(adpribose) glycohydrolase, putative [Acanthamoeba castellanii str. Neff]